jgi:hypothetical protein
MLRWASENLLPLKLEEIGEHYGRYSLHVPEAERAMAKSLERYGQLSPVVVCRRGERYELVDGFKRLGAARRLAQIEHLSGRLMEADERTVKAAIYGLNRAGGRTRELEEAWFFAREEDISHEVPDAPLPEAVAKEPFFGSRRDCGRIASRGSR